MTRIAFGEGWELLVSSWVLRKSFPSASLTGRYLESLRGGEGVAFLEDAGGGEKS